MGTIFLGFIFMLGVCSFIIALMTLISYGADKINEVKTDSTTILFVVTGYIGIGIFLISLALGEK